MDYHYLEKIEEVQQEEKLQAKIQCWNKYYSEDRIINDNVSDPHNLAAFNTDELMKQHEKYKPGFR